MCREYRTIARTDDAMIAVIRERGMTSSDDNNMSARRWVRMR